MDYPEISGNRQRDKGKARPITGHIGPEGNRRTSVQPLSPGDTGKISFLLYARVGKQ